jgi:hypothetical protein
MPARNFLTTIMILLLTIASAATAPRAAGAPEDITELNAAVPEVPSFGLVEYGNIAQALALLTSTITELQLEGELTAAGQERLALLIGGITGQLFAEAQAYQPSDSGSFNDFDDIGQGGPPPGNDVYLSQILPSRQIILSSPTNAASPNGEAGKELSVWIDDAGNVFVAGDPASTDSMQQLSLKQGWEKDYDKLSGEIEQMLAEFMKQHAEPPPAEDGAQQPGEAL